MPDENPSGLGIFDLPLRLPGQYFDKETNLHYNYFRDYDSGIGRYVQSDPVGLVGGINTYAYVGSDPLSFVDPTGELFFVAALPFIGGGSVSLSGIGSALAGGAAMAAILSIPSSTSSSSTAASCPADDRFGQCRDQWIDDTKWCDNRFKGRRNVACHRWAEEEFERCKKDQPRQPFRL